MTRDRRSHGLLLVAALLAVACGDSDTGAGASGSGGSAGSAGSGGNDAVQTSAAETSSSQASGGDGQGGGGGSIALTCTPDGRPNVPCNLENDDLECVITVEGAGCPDATTIWRCIHSTDHLDEPYSEWAFVTDTECACSVESDEEACAALPGCVWALPPDTSCDTADTDAQPITEAGCYREGCGTEDYGDLGIVDGSCNYDICTAFPDD